MCSKRHFYDKTWVTLFFMDKWKAAVIASKSSFQQTQSWATHLDPFNLEEKANAYYWATSMDKFPLNKLTISALFVVWLPHFPAEPKWGLCYIQHCIEGSWRRPCCKGIFSFYPRISRNSPLGLLWAVPAKSLVRFRVACARPTRLWMGLGCGLSAESCLLPQARLALGPPSLYPPHPEMPPFCHPQPTVPIKLGWCRPHLAGWPRGCSWPLWASTTACAAPTTSQGDTDMPYRTFATLLGQFRGHVLA